MKHGETIHDFMERKKGESEVGSTHTASANDLLRTFITKRLVERAKSIPVEAQEEGLQSIMELIVKDADYISKVIDRGVHVYVANQVDSTEDSVCIDDSPDTALTSYFMRKVLDYEEMIRDKSRGENYLCKNPDEFREKLETKEALAE